MEAFYKTLILALTAPLIAVILGWTFAYLTERHVGRSRTIWRLIPLCSVCLPLFIHATAWEATIGKFGWLQLSSAAARSSWFSGAIASSWIHGVAGAAWVALIVGFFLSRRRLPQEDAARLEASQFRALYSIVMPSTWPITSLAGLWVALIAATEISVVDLYGYRTLADEVYFQYALAAQPLPMLFATMFPAVIAIGILGILLSRIAAPLLQTTELQMEPHRLKQDSASSVSLLVLTLISVLMIWLPLSSLVIKAGWVVTHDAGELVSSWSLSTAIETVCGAWTMFGTEFRWTAKLVITVIVMTLPCSILLASAFRSVPRSMLIVCVAWFLIPGPVVSVIVMRLFSLGGIGIFETLYDRTLIPTAICVMYRSVPLCVLILAGGFRLSGRRIDEAALLDGADRWSRIVWIHLPRQIHSLVLCAFAAGIVALGEISATELVLPPGVSTVARRVFGLLHSGVRYQESGLCLISCVLVISLVLGVQYLHLRYQKAFKHL